MSLTIHHLVYDIQNIFKRASTQALDRFNIKNTIYYNEYIITLLECLTLNIIRIYYESFLDMFTGKYKYIVILIQTVYSYSRWGIS